MVLRSLTLALMLASCAVARAPTGSAVLDRAAPPNAILGSQARGGAYAQAQCASCHSIGIAGTSPLSTAPPLREINRRYPVEQLGEAFAEGFVTAHSTMPEFVLNASQNRDLIAYLASIQTE